MSPQGLSASTVPTMRARHFSYHHQGWLQEQRTWFTYEGKRCYKPTHNQLILVGVVVLNCGKGREISCLEFSRVEIRPSWLPHVICQEFVFSSQSVTNPAILGFSVNGFCLWNQGVFLLCYVLLGYDEFSLGGRDPPPCVTMTRWRVSLTLCSDIICLSAADNCF